MSATPPLVLFNQLLFLGLALAAFWGWHKGRGRRHGALALMLGTLMVPALLGALQLAGVEAFPIFERMSSISMMLHPFFMLGLVSTLSPIAPPMIALTGVALVVSMGALVLLPIPLPGPWISALVMIWVVVEGYAAGVLYVSAQRAQGLRRWRLNLAATGSVLLALIILGAGAQQLLPAFADRIAPWSSLGGLFAGLSWTVGFLPPRPLVRVGQVLELHRFLETGGGLSIVERASALERRLGPAVIRTLGAIDATVVMREMDGGSMDAVWGFGSTEPERAFPVTWSGDDGRGWIRSVQELDETPYGELARRAGARSVLAVPIVLEGEVLGEVIAYLSEGTLFPKDELRMVALFAEQVAASGQQARMLAEQLEMVRQLKRRNEHLKASQTRGRSGLERLEQELIYPLEKVTGFAELIDVAPNQDHPELITELLQAAEELRSMVRVMTTLSAIENGTLSLRRRRLLLHSFLVERVAAFAPRALAMGVELHVQAGDDPGVVELDPEQLGCMVDTMLERAIRASGEGGQVTLLVEHDPDHVRVEVRESGAGLRPEELAQVFLPLSKWRPGASRRCHGMGPGLTLMTELAELYAGTVGVDSTWGHGATCWLVLPRIVGDAEGELADRLSA